MFILQIPNIFIEKGAQKTFWRPVFRTASKAVRMIFSRFEQSFITSSSPVPYEENENRYHSSVVHTCFNDVFLESNEVPRDAPRGLSDFLDSFSRSNRGH